MPKLATPLTNARIRKAAPRAKPYKLSDGQNLYLEVMPNGTRCWRMRYRRGNGKPSSVSFGHYPEVSLAAARAERNRVLRLLAEGKDPIDVKRAQASQPVSTNFRLSVNAEGDLIIEKTRNRLRLNAAQVATLRAFLIATCEDSEGV